MRKKIRMSRRQRWQMWLTQAISWLLLRGEWPVVDWEWAGGVARCTVWGRKGSGLILWHGWRPEVALFWRGKKQIAGQQPRLGVLPPSGDDDL